MTRILYAVSKNSKNIGTDTVPSRRVVDSLLSVLSLL